MARTPDRMPGPSDEEGTYYEPTVSTTVAGEQRYNGTRFSLFDSIGEYDPRGAQNGTNIGTTGLGLFIQRLASGILEFRKIITAGTLTQQILPGGELELSSNASADFDKIVTTRSSCLVFVFRSNGNVVTYR